MTENKGDERSQTLDVPGPRARLEDFATTSGCWFWETDADLRFTYFSRSVFDITGQTPEWHYGKTRSDLGVPDAMSQENWIDHLGQVNRREPFSEFVYQRAGPDGIKWMRSDGVPIFDADGIFVGYRGTGRDITAEITARQDVEQLAAAVQSLDELFALWDCDDRLVICNESFLRLNEKVIETTRPGTLFEEHIRAAVAAGLCPAAKGRENEWLEERLHRHRNPGEPMELPRQSGQWLLIREQRLADGSTVTYSTNISERKKIENELADYLKRERDALRRITVTEALQRSTLASMTEGVVMRDADGKILLTNPAAEEIFGLTIDQMVRRMPFDSEWTAIREDGSQFPVEQYPGLMAQRTGKPQRGAIIGIHKPDEPETWISVNAEPVFSGDTDTPAATVITFRDITEDRKKENLLVAQAEQLRKFAYLASHDLREPLRKISVFADFLDEELSASGLSDPDGLVDRIRTAARCGSLLVEDVLRFSLLADKTLERQWVNLQDVIDETVGQYDKDSISLSMDIAIRELRADRNLLKICISNILDNAIKYCEAGQRPNIEIRTMFNDESQFHELAISDNGIGFDPQYKSRIFEPFTRLVAKHSYEGSGIGLSFVKDILAAHGWHIDVDSEPGKGSVFRIRVPIRDVSLST